MNWRGLIPSWGKKATQLTYDQIAQMIDGTQGGNVAGVLVNDKTALQVSTVLACVKAIADGCATPKLHVLREDRDGRGQKATNIPEYRLLNRRPNEWQTSYEWRRMMTMHAALTGAGLSIKVRGDNKRVRELIPVMPGRWDVRRIARYEVRYRCWDDFGLIGEFMPDDVFVLHGLQWDWLAGMNAVHLARAAIGLAIASERSQASFHENGMRPSGTYSVEGTLSGEQHEQLTRWLRAAYAGPEKAGTPLVLDRAAKWLNVGQSGVDAQHIETRRMQVEEICRGYNVFPIIVGHGDKAATFASTEAFFGAHLKLTLSPWHEAWTQRIDETLLDGSGPLYAEFDVRYLTAGSMKDRAQWARTMTEMGIYTRNEIRDEEGKDALPGLDAPLTPMNMNQGGGKPAPQAGADDDEALDATQAA
jgi:HK97 family phage portal protein